jgi:hypothetical protein
MKVFIIPHLTGKKEWKLNDFHTHEKWINKLTSDQLATLDIIPMGGEIDIGKEVMKPTCLVMRIL